MAPCSMSSTTLLVSLVIILPLVMESCLAMPQIQPDNNKQDMQGPDYADYYDEILHNIFNQQKRGSICMPFGMSCATKGISCCGETTACRCNLFGGNCKCNRAGLFGKKR
eukprot:TRINITY_DN29624_c1_g1_i1.p1 TRINITY_DN29624_c1_g1~~TRINITY_DN29624_c1_g1_i1.p1  ORF type:complete len:110 (-),score=17.63 TRINITY_DN29624_c1_g1_i1:83-412(-)